SMKRAIASLIWLAAICHSASCAATGFSYSASSRPALKRDADAVAANACIVTLTSGDSNQNGDFQGDSAGNGDGSNAGGTGAGSNAWAIYANSGQTANARASVPALATKAIDSAGEFISLDFDNGFID